MCRVWAKRFCEHTNKCYFKTRGCPAYADREDAIPANWYCPVYAYLDYRGADNDD